MDVGVCPASRIVAPYRPTVPLDELVEWLNRFYHAVEAASYDTSHPEIHIYLPPLWREMIRTVVATGHAGPWSVLDLGCGTGFEAEQILANFPSEKLARLVCYDPSPEMLARCHEKIASRYPQATFVSDLKAIPTTAGQFNVLATNSLLHHLPNPWSTIGALLPLLSEDAFWLQGHEPSRRFYTNRRCAALYDAYRRRSRWLRWFSPRKYAARLRMLLRGGDPATVAAEESHRAGLFARRPPASVVRMLVDFHVPHSASAQDVCAEGFDFEEMQTAIADQWQLKWVRTYSYMGSIPEHLLSSAWKRQAADLRRQFPHDGANFCCVWKRQK